MNVKSIHTEATGEKTGLELAFGARSKLGFMIVQMSALFTTIRRKATICLTSKNRDKFCSIIAPDESTWDNSVIELSTRTMKEMELLHGDVTLVTGHYGKKTLVVCFAKDVFEDNSVNMSSVVRRNLGVCVGSSVHIWSLSKLRYLKRIAVVLIDGNFECPIDAIFDLFLLPYFNAAFRPLMQDNIFTCDAGAERAAFKVTALDPPGYGIVAQDTLIFLDVSYRQPGIASLKKSGRGKYGRISSLLDALGRSIGVCHIAREKIGGETLGNRQSRSCSTEALISNG